MQVCIRLAAKACLPPSEVPSGETLTYLSADTYTVAAFERAEASVVAFLQGHFHSIPPALFLPHCLRAVLGTQRSGGCLCPVGSCVCLPEVSPEQQRRIEELVEALVMRGLMDAAVSGGLSSSEVAAGAVCGAYHMVVYRGGSPTAAVGEVLEGLWEGGLCGEVGRVAKVVGHSEAAVVLAARALLQRHLVALGVDPSRDAGSARKHNRS